MSLRNISLIWLPRWLQPTPGAFHVDWGEGPSFNLETFESLGEAVKAAMSQRDARGGQLPWIKVGTGEGSAIFNIQGIIVLSEIVQGRRT